MSENSPTLEEWRRLYEAAIRVKELAPWEWMTEENIFGFQNPETDELGFVSVMGMLGEHYSIAIYLGAKGLYGFWDLVNSGPEGPPEKVLEIPQLQASFEDRRELHKEDREVIKKLGLKFRGRSAWPLFRSYRPGFFPWFVEADEARFLTYGLEQALDVAPRFRQDLSLLRPPTGRSWLVRVPQRRDDALAWEDRILEVLPPEPASISIEMDVQMLKGLKRLSQSNTVIEADFFMFPSPVREGKGARPVFPYLLMMVEARSGFILGSEMLSPDPSLEAMWGQIPLNAVRQLAAAGIRPKEIKVRSELLSQLLQPLAQELRFQLKRSRRLGSLDRAKNALLQRFAM